MGLFGGWDYKLGGVCGRMYVSLSRRMFETLAVCLWLA